MITAGDRPVVARVRARRACTFAAPSSRRNFRTDNHQT